MNINSLHKVFATLSCGFIYFHFKKTALLICHTLTKRYMTKSMPISSFLLRGRGCIYPLLERGGGRSPPKTWPGRFYWISVKSSSWPRSYKLLTNTLSERELSNITTWERHQTCHKRRLDQKWAKQTIKIKQQSFISSFLGTGSGESWVAQRQPPPLRHQQVLPLWGEREEITAYGHGTRCVKRASHQQPGMMTAPVGPLAPGPLPASPPQTQRRHAGVRWCSTLQLLSQEPLWGTVRLRCRSVHVLCSTLGAGDVPITAPHNLHTDENTEVGIH